MQRLYIKTFISLYFSHIHTHTFLSVFVYWSLSSLFSFFPRTIFSFSTFRYYYLSPFTKPYKHKNKHQKKKKSLILFVPTIWAFQAEKTEIFTVKEKNSVSLFLPSLWFLYVKRNFSKESHCTFLRVSQGTHIYSRVLASSFVFFFSLTSD